MSTSPFKIAGRAGFMATSLGLGIAVLGATAAAASTPTGYVTIKNLSGAPITTPQAPTAPFVATVPPGAACPFPSSSTDPTKPANQIFSFMVPATVDPGTLNFGTGSPSQGYGYFDSFGTYAGGLNTGSAGEVTVVNSNQYQMSGVPFTAPDPAGPTGTQTWHTGWACSQGGTVTRYWQQDVTFTASAGSYTWTPVANVSPAAPEVPLTVALPLGSAGVLGAGVLVNRRRSRRVATNL